MKLTQYRKRLSLCCGRRDPRRSLLGDVDLGRLLAAEAGDHPGHDQHEAVGAGVDDARLGEDVELIGRPLDRLRGRPR